MLKVPFEGLLEFATYLKDKWNGSAPTLHLYKSTYTPDDNSVLADFVSNEIDATGYAPVDLDSWGDAFIDGIRAKIINDAKTFECTSGSSAQSVGG